MPPWSTTPPIAREKTMETKINGMPDDSIAALRRVLRGMVSE